MSNRFTQEEFIELTRDLNRMFEGGHSMSQCLTTAAQQQKNKHLQKIMMQVHDVVIAGYPLSFAMAKYPAVFDESFVQLVRQGELNGNLDIVLRDFLSSEESNRSST